MRLKSHKMNSNNAKWVLGHKITPHDSSGDFDLMFALTPSKVKGPPPHFHNLLKESFLIIEGEMEFYVNGKINIIKAGESIDIPPGAVHTFANKSDKSCKWVNIHSPKGFRSFFEDLGVSETEENAIEKSIAPEIIAKVMATASNYDMIIKV